MSVNTLAFAAIVMLVINPMTIYDIGFQLSFTAVLAILLIYPILDPLIPFHVQQRHHWLKWLWGLMTVSLSAQAGTAPLVIYYFGRFPTWFLLGNFIVVPLATIILYLSLLMIVTSWWPALQAVVVTILSSVVVTMNGLIQYIVALPANSIEVTHFSALQVILLYILISSVCVLISIAVQEFRRNG
jgi:competence protein ComEC